MGQAQINVRTRACSRTSIARTRQAALTHNVRGKELNSDGGAIGRSMLETGVINIVGVRQKRCHRLESVCPRLTLVIHLRHKI